MNYGCLPPKVDIRNYKIKANAVFLPTSFELECHQKIKDQGEVSSCVAHAASSILEYFDNGEHELSTNFIYGFKDRNYPGMYLQDACKITKDYGDMLEEDCPGNNEVPIACLKYQTAAKNAMALDTAKHFRITSYFDCPTNDDIKYAIMHYGPVLGCVKWYDKYTIRDGVVYMQNDCGFGYHAILIYGWNETGFLCQNSWGTDFANFGKFILPYDQTIIEAKAMIDFVPDENDNHFIIPKTNPLLDIIYKILNFILNLFKKEK